MPVVDGAGVKGWLITGIVEGFMPLMADLGLVVEEDGVSVSLKSHGVALKIQIELSESHDV